MDALVWAGFSVGCLLVAMSFDFDPWKKVVDLAKSWVPWLRRNDEWFVSVPVRCDEWVRDAVGEDVSRSRVRSALGQEVSL